MGVGATTRREFSECRDESRGDPEREGRSGHLRRLRSGRGMAEEALDHSGARTLDVRRRPERVCRESRPRLRRAARRAAGHPAADDPQTVGPRTQHRVPDRPAAVAGCDHRQPSEQRRQRAAGRGRDGGVGQGQQDGRRRPMGALRAGVRRPGQPAARDGELDAVGRQPAAAALHRHQPLRCGEERVADRRPQARDLQVLARRQDQAA